MSQFSEMSLIRRFGQKFGHGLRNQRQFASNKKPKELPQVSYNDLASPEGDWHVNYNNLQKKNNLHLVLGVGFFVSTIVFGFATNQLETLNSIPEEPAEIDFYSKN